MNDSVKILALFVAGLTRLTMNITCPLNKVCLCVLLVCHTVYIASQKYIPDIIDCNLKYDYQIVIISGASIFDTTYLQMTVQVFTSPNVLFCSTWGKQNKRNMH